MKEDCCTSIILQSGKVLIGLPNLQTCATIQEKERMTSRTDSDAEAQADRDAIDVEVGVRGPEGSAKSHRASPNP